MSYVLKGEDNNIVLNIRFELKETVSKFSDEQIAETWRHFSQSDDFYAENRNEKFLEWLNDL